MAPRFGRRVLFVNPKAGGGKSERFDLVAECCSRGIVPVVLAPGDDVRALALAEVTVGDEVIGMAGGDGSQAAVATAASAHDVPFVCVPAGTRNHFAADIGIDRSDVVGALDAFDHAEERRIDMASVNGRVYLNTASLGLYARIVSSPQYRDAKAKTVAQMLPDLLGPGSEPFDLRFTGPDGVTWAGAHVLLVSNNRYEPVNLGGQGARGRMDSARPVGQSFRGPGRRREGWRHPTLPSGIGVDHADVARRLRRSSRDWARRRSHRDGSSVVVRIAAWRSADPTARTALTLRLVHVGFVVRDERLAL